MKKNLAVVFILALALFLRTYRASILTGFYFDQGRDAKIIWDLWHHHKFFLIGPTTGIEGIFLGPGYYYLITPFYILGNGSPVAAAAGLALICVLGIYIIYLIGKNYFSYLTGLIAAILAACSLGLVQSQRWLSNPTPLYLSSALAVLLLMKVVFGSKSGWVWFLLGLTLGVSLHFEAASAIFFLPATLIIFLCFRKDISWNFQNFLHLAFSFLITLLPQLIFDFKHNHILTLAFRRFLISERSFSSTGTGFYLKRLGFYYQSFADQITLEKLPNIFIFLLLLLLTVTILRKLPKKPMIVLLIWFLTPMICLLFYKGNYGYIWSYYFTGVYLVFLLIVAVVLSYTYTYSGLLFKKGLVGLLVVYFIFWNGLHLYNYLRANPDGETAVMLGSSLAAVDWIYGNAQNQDFNVDVYVPPVIPHAYDYLFLWRGSTKFHRLPSPKLQSLLYTLYEVDPPHPERLNSWLIRQEGIAKPLSSIRFGGVTVDKRQRL